MLKINHLIDEEKRFQNIFLVQKARRAATKRSCFIFFIYPKTVTITRSAEKNLQRCYKCDKKGHIITNIKPKTVKMQNPKKSFAIQENYNSKSCYKIWLESTDLQQENEQKKILKLKNIFVINGMLLYRN